MEIPEPELKSIAALYERGLYLQALDKSKAFGALKNWRGTRARVLAGRLAANLGAPRLSDALHFTAWRRAPTDPEAAYYYARVLLRHFGPLKAWQFLRRYDAQFVGPASLPAGTEAGTTDYRGDWLALHAYVLGRLRDFDRAEEWISRAETLAPKNPWICIERSYLLELQDRYEEALAAAQQALALRPWFRPGVQAAAHVLQLLDRDQDALKLLGEAGERLESCYVLLQLAPLQTELGLHADARQTYEKAVALCPLLEKEFAYALNAQRSDAAYYCGDLAKAAELAKESKSSFHKKVAESLANPPADGKRVLLQVGFVRQHHMTCAPATLSALSRYWSMPAPHLTLAEEICYDGTPSHSERNWAEQNGYVAREFTVTWDSAVALLDRGVPFTITTVEAVSSHLQAVIGYDSFRRTLLIRDPYERHFGEFLVEPMLKRYRATGPRGMALAPKDKPELLADLQLPDAELYDLFHVLQRSLLKHNRPAAMDALAALQARAPEHRLFFQAKNSLAFYDGDRLSGLKCQEELLKHFPDEPTLLLAKLSSLRNLARRDERVALLKTASEKKDADPVFWQQYAQELAADAREHEQAIGLLRRAIRCRPSEPGSYYILANVLWSQRRFEHSLELYRFATCLADKDEQLARAYFIGCQHLKQSAAALEFLQNRFRRFGKKSSNTAFTLFWAHNQLDKVVEALAVLDESLKLRPDDSELALFAADAFGRYGRMERATQLLASVKGKSQLNAWLRTAAELASYRGELQDALALWRQVLDSQPLALDAHRAVARLLAETESPAAALTHLKTWCERFPHSFPLHQFWLDWLRDDDPAGAEQVVRKMIDQDPVDAWARRELALLLSRQGKLDEAFAAAETAQQLEPSSPYAYSVRGQLYVQAGKLEQARADFRRAIQLSVDSEVAINELVAACNTKEERREALAFIKGELERQVIFGDGLLAYRERARDTLEPQELLASLREALTARPDLWHAWSAVTWQLLDLNQLDEAVQTARQATERFPLLPRVWLDLASVQQARLDPAGEIDALQHALQINPAWGVAVRQLASAYQRRGEFAKARDLLTQAVAHTPLDGPNHGGLALTLWRLGEREAAIERLQHALRLDPGYEWAWRTLREWCEELGKPEVAVELARDLTTRRPGEARSWLLLAETLSEIEGKKRDVLSDCLAALDKAVALDPRLGEAHDLRARLLVEAERYDEAIAACRPAAWGDACPIELRGRAAWIEAQRGNMKKAVALMEAAVKDEPQYYWGWCRLADWQRDAEAHAAYLQASQALVKLAPQQPVPYGYLGDAKLQNKDRAGAKEAFRHAVEIAPDYGYAGRCLFDLQLEDGELDAAGQTVANLRKHVPDEFTVVRELALACKRKDIAPVEGLFRELLSFKELDRDSTGFGVSALAEAGWSAHAERVLSEMFDQPDAPPHVARLWVERQASLKRWRAAARRLAARDGREDFWRSGAVAFLESAAQANKARLVQRFIAEHRDALRAHDESWGSTGYALVTLQKYRESVEWLGDYASRAGLRPWMLLNLAVSLRSTGRFAEAVQVNRKAAELERDHCSSAHALWLALDEALAGDTPMAESRLSKIEHGSLRPFYQSLRKLVQAALEMYSEQKKPYSFNRARRHIKEAANIYSAIAADAPLIYAYRQVIWHVAKRQGGWGARLWAVATIVGLWLKRR